MSMLSRFRKQGGFQQLLTLIETCDSVKQQNLLHLVCVEDPGWAYLVKVKCLSLDRIFSWPESILLELASNIPEKICVPLYFSLNDEHKLKLRAALSTAMTRSLDEGLSGVNPSQSEQNAARIKVIQIVRSLESEGKIKFQTFDPILVIDPAIAA